MPLVDDDDPAFRAAVDAAVQEAVKRVIDVTLPNLAKRVEAKG